MNNALPRGGMPRPWLIPANPSAESLIEPPSVITRSSTSSAKVEWARSTPREHQQLHHLTACKVLRAEVANHPETVERFLQEAPFISRIRPST